jgi:hypothetical protein
MLPPVEKDDDVKKDDEVDEMSDKKDDPVEEPKDAAPVEPVKPVEMEWKLMFR